MQTKSSYRVLKWTLLVGTAASLATACVVTTSGDGGGDGGEISFGGDGTSTSGKTSTGGSTATAGTTSTGGSAGTSTTAGTGTAGGEGGAASDYVPGLCQVDDPTPTSLPFCDPDAVRDKDQPCKICMKAECCDEWQTCYGDTPKTACGWGPTETAPGQFDCIQQCYLKTPNASDDVQGTLQDCESTCLLQCAEKDTDGFALNDTQALLGCAQDKCLTECFP
jgi:hypothetical protein